MNANEADEETNSQEVEVGSVQGQQDENFEQNNPLDTIPEASEKDEDITWPILTTIYKKFYGTDQEL